MLRLGWMRLLPVLCSLLLGRAEAPSPGLPPEQSRSYEVLRRQSLGKRGGAEGARLQRDPGVGSLYRAGAGPGPGLWLWEANKRHYKMVLISIS